MKHLLTNTLPPAVVVCLAIWLVAEYQTRVKLTAEHQALEQQCQQMADLAAKNEQLAKLLAQATAPEPLSPDEQMELLRLRGEVGLLRRQKPDLADAREQNRQIHALLERYRQMNGTNATADFWPQGSWANAGYGTPEAGLQTIFWAGYNGDLTNFTASMAGEADTNFFNGLYQGKTATEQSVRLQDALYNIKSVQVLGRNMVDANTVVLTLGIEDQDNYETANMVMKKDGDAWKLAGPDDMPVIAR